MYISPEEAQQTDNSIVEEFIQLVKDSYPVTINAAPPHSSSQTNASGLKVVFFNLPDYEICTSTRPGVIDVPMDSGKLLALLYGGQPVKAEWIRQLLAQNVWKNGRPMEADFLPEDVCYHSRPGAREEAADYDLIRERESITLYYSTPAAVQTRLKSVLSGKPWKDTVFIWPSAKVTKDESLQKAVEFVGGTNINCPTTIKARNSNDALQQAIANQVENYKDKKENKVFKAIYVKPMYDSKVPSDLELLPSITHNNLIAAITREGQFDRLVTLPPGQKEEEEYVETEVVGNGDVGGGKDTRILADAPSAEASKKRKPGGHSATPDSQATAGGDDEEEGEEIGGHHAVIQISQDVEMKEEEDGCMVQQPEPGKKKHHKDTTKVHLPNLQQQQQQQPLGDGWTSTKQFHTNPNITNFPPIPEHMRQPPPLVIEKNSSDKKKNMKGDGSEWDQGVIDPELEGAIPIKKNMNKNKRGKSRGGEEEEDGDHVMKGGEGESVVVVAPLVLASRVAAVGGGGGGEALYLGRRRREKGGSSGRGKQRASAIVNAPSPLKNFKAFKKAAAAAASSQQKKTNSSNNMSVVIVPFSAEVYREELPDGDAYMRKERTRQAEDEDAELLFNAKVKAKKVPGGAEMKKAPAQRKTAAATTGGGGGRGGRGGGAGRGRGKGIAKESETESEFDDSSDEEVS